MKLIAGYLKVYLREINLTLFILITLALSVLISVNYYFNLNSLFLHTPDFFARFSRFYWLYASVFVGTYIAGCIIQGKPFPRHSFFYLLLAAAPAIFAAKVSLKVSNIIDLSFLDEHWEAYYNTVLQWPLKATLVYVFVTLLWRIGKYPSPVFGLGSNAFESKPYFILLGLMIPLLVIAGLGDDFQHAYPKLHLVEFIDPVIANPIPAKLLFEVLYGLDFFTIELFFRGFLILAFIKYAGKDAILPMAVFYCAIHFGKPVAECISSYFGGLILGVIIYHTRSIWGGLIIHLGIAWMMEIVGILM